MLYVVQSKTAMSCLKGSLSSFQLCRSESVGPQKRAEAAAQRRRAALKRNAKCRNGITEGFELFNTAPGLKIASGVWL